MSKTFLRCLIVLFWLTLFFGGLYLPHWSIFSKQNTLNVFAWGDILDPALIAAFEKETGIHLHLNYYSSNEELLVKLKATKGEGYDLIIPSDYAVALLIQEKLLQAIDPTKFLFWKELHPKLLHHSFDPDNTYSIPFAWEVFGLGIDREYFSQEFFPSWKMVFDKASISYKIAMVNDPIEALLFAAHYLYGPLESLNPEQLSKVKELLIQQKKWVEAYADFRADYFLATKNCPVVVCSNSYIERSARNFPFVQWVIPQEGAFITIENCCIPKASKKEKEVYKLLNFLYDPEHMTANCQALGLLPSTVKSMSLTPFSPSMKKLIDSLESFTQLYFIKPLLSPTQTRELWVEIKTERASS